MSIKVDAKWNRLEMTIEVLNEPIRTKMRQDKISHTFIESITTCEKIMGWNAFWRNISVDLKREKNHWALPTMFLLYKVNIFCEGHRILQHLHRMESLHAVVAFSKYMNFKIWEHRHSNRKVLSHCTTTKVRSNISIPKDISPIVMEQLIEFRIWG